MSEIISIDFGTSNTVLVRLNKINNSGENIFLENYSRKFFYKENNQQKECLVIPSLISFNKDKIYVGKEVIDKGLEISPATFKFLKRYLLSNQDIKRQMDNKAISYQQAAEIFINNLIIYSQKKYQHIETIIFTHPVCSFENYRKIISKVCAENNIKNYFFVDESTASILGYNVKLHPENIVLIFDFGAGTLDISVVKIKDIFNANNISVLAKDGDELGGMDIDKELYKDFLNKNNLAENSIEHLSNLVVQEIEKAKINLSFNKEANIEIFDYNNANTYSAHYTREYFEEILNEKKVLHKIQKTLDRTLSKASCNGICKEDINEVLLVGGSSLIPAVQKLIKQNFDSSKVKLHNPFLAVASGACKFNNLKLNDITYNDYAIKHINPNSGAPFFKTIIPAGTPYPLNEDIVKIFDGSQKGQLKVGLEIYEIKRGKNHNDIELIFDKKGNAKLTEVYYTDKLNFLNKKNPTFINLNPPATGNEKRLKASFNIDGLKRLIVTVEDLKTNKVLLKNHPVVEIK